jgi:hypothetical protein
MLAYTVEQYGRDRSYTVKFGIEGKSPMVWVNEDDCLLASFWLDNGEMHSTYYYNKQ